MSDTFYIKNKEGQDLGITVKDGKIYIYDKNNKVLIQIAIDTLSPSPEKPWST